MADNKKSFILYCEWESTFNMLSDEKAGQLIKYIFDYVNDKNPTSSNDLLNVAFEPIKQQFKRDLIKWEDIRKKRSAAGKASANKRKQNQQVLTNANKRQQTPTNPTVDVDVDVLHNPHIPPLSEFLEYAEKNLKGEYKQYENSLRFKYLSWAENKWHTGGEKSKPIKNWKTTLLNTIPYLKTENQNGKQITSAFAKSLRAARQDRIKN